MIKKSDWLPSRIAPNQNPYRWSKEFAARSGSYVFSLRTPWLAFLVAVLFSLTAPALAVISVFAFIENDVHLGVLTILAALVLVVPSIWALVYTKRMINYKDQRDRPSIARQQGIGKK